MNMLSGYKTYIVSALLVASVLAEMVGIDVPGFVIPDNWMMIVLNGLGLASLRAAVGKL